MGQSEYLKVRSHDPEEAIRHDVIVTIINAGKKDLNLVDDQLLGFVRDRTLDKRVTSAADVTAFLIPGEITITFLHWIYVSDLPVASTEGGHDGFGSTL